MLLEQVIKNSPRGSGCGTVGITVTSDTRGTGFESTQSAIALKEHIVTVYCIEKGKEAGKGSFLTCLNLSKLANSELLFYDSTKEKIHNLSL